MRTTGSAQSISAIPRVLPATPLAAAPARPSLGHKLVSCTTPEMWCRSSPGRHPRPNLLTGGLEEYFSRTDSAGARSFLTDALGSTLALTDSTGTTQTSYTFDPF